jgi:hypothetical protein
VRSTRDFVHDSRLDKNVEVLLMNVNSRRRRCGVGAIRNGGEMFVWMLGQKSSRLSSAGKGWFIAASDFFEVLERPCMPVLGIVMAIPHTHGLGMRGHKLCDSVFW